MAVGVDGTALYAPGASALEQHAEIVAELLGDTMAIQPAEKEGLVIT